MKNEIPIGSAIEITPLPCPPNSEVKLETSRVRNPAYFQYASTPTSATTVAARIQFRTRGSAVASMRAPAT